MRSGSYFVAVNVKRWAMVLLAIGHIYEIKNGVILRFVKKYGCITGKPYFIEDKGV
jgi:hypothetical protein